jgi:hypothetical protein
MLDEMTVVKTIIETLDRLQEAGGFNQVRLERRSCPVAELNEFDSQLWVLAMTLIADELDIEIADSSNIFVSDSGDNLDLAAIAQNVLAKLGGTK